jgi:SLT domain-containing protein
MVNQALQIMGQPATFANSTLRRMNQESGGNPTIVNRTDSNWTAGTPSVGLMQVIGPTYRANRHPAYDKGPYTYGVSTDPLANTLASMRYALGRYGSLPAAYDRPGGYKDGGYIFDEGGMLPTGISVVNNQTGKPEPLLNADKSISLDTGSIMQLARVLAQLLAGRPAKLMLPDGRMLAETVGDSIIGEATAPGVSY